MTTQTKEIIDLANRLETNLKFNRDTFEEALREFMREIREAQNFINKDGAEFVRKVAKELVASFKDEINSYLNLVINQTENDLGRCGPLANVYESIRVAGCNRIVNPLVCSLSYISETKLIMLSIICLFNRRMDSGLV